MDARRTAHRREGRVLEILHHDAVIVRGIPRLRVVRVGIKMPPQRQRCGLAYRGGYGVVEHHIAVLLPRGEIGKVQHRRARLDRGEPARGFLRVASPATAALMRAICRGATPPVVATIQRSNSSKLGACRPRKCPVCSRPSPLAWMTRWSRWRSCSVAGQVGLAARPSSATTGA